MKLSYILLLIMAFGHNGFAQSEDHSIPLSFAYLNYDLDGHGIMLSTERDIKDDFVIEAVLSAYTHGSEDQSISFNAFFSRRFTYDSGFSPQFGLGLGLVNTWIDSEDRTGPSMDLEERAGELSISTSLKVSPFGWDFRTKKDIPIRLFIDCILQAQYPELKSVDPYVLFQFGTTYYFRYVKKNIEEG